VPSPAACTTRCRARVRYIAAGGYNTASGEGALVDGGFNSTGQRHFATIPGGYANSAAGTYSFAAGARASAAQPARSCGATAPTATRCSPRRARISSWRRRGVTFWTNAEHRRRDTRAGIRHVGLSERSQFEDRRCATRRCRSAGESRGVADRALELQVERGVRHVGPMAQDFYAAFGVGEDDKAHSPRSTKTASRSPRSRRCTPEC